MSKVSGMTVTELHRRTGISRTVLQGYLKGKFVPGGWELTRLCDVLLVSPNRLLYGIEKPFDGSKGLRDMLGDVTKAHQTSKVAVLLQMMRTEELQAFAILFESIASARLGANQVKMAMAAVDAMIGTDDGEPGLFETFANDTGFISNLQKAVTPEMIRKLDAKVKRATAPPPTQRSKGQKAVPATPKSEDGSK